MMPESYPNLKETLDKMLASLVRIEERLGKGDVLFATQELRLKNLERIAFGLIGISVTTAAGLIVALITRNI